jgi:Xaa-Pro dipeptidase
MTDFATALAAFRPVTGLPIALPELLGRVGALQAQLLRDGIKAVWLDASTSLTYFTGTVAGPVRTIHGALVPATGAGDLIYVSPQFEAPKLRSLLRIAGEIAVWEEDEAPTP